MYRVICAKRSKYCSSFGRRFRKLISFGWLQAGFNLKKAGL